MNFTNYEFITLLITNITLICAVYRFNKNDTKEWRKEHREDIQKMDEKINKMDEKWDNIIQRMDEKWERLFERLLIQDKGKM